MKVIPISTKEEREYQAARLAYKAAPTMPNFHKMQVAYAVMAGEEVCSLTKK